MMPPAGAVSVYPAEIFTVTAPFTPTAFRLDTAAAIEVKDPGIVYTPDICALEVNAIDNTAASSAIALFFMLKVFRVFGFCPNLGHFL
jgi:hypothetical protein